MRNRSQSFFKNAFNCGILKIFLPETRNQSYVPQRILLTFQSFSYYFRLKLAFNSEWITISLTIFSFHLTMHALKLAGIPVEQIKGKLPAIALNAIPARGFLRTGLHSKQHRKVHLYLLRHLFLLSALMQKRWSTPKSLNSWQGDRSLQHRLTCRICPQSRLRSKGAQQLYVKRHSTQGTGLGLPKLTAL